MVAEIVFHLNVSADGSNNDTCSLPVGFFLKQVRQKVVVVVIQMADRFVQQDKIEGLAQAAYEGYPLLLPERQASRFFIYLVRQSGGLEERQYLFLLLVAGQLVFSSTFSRAVSSGKSRSS